MAPIVVQVGIGDILCTPNVWTSFPGNNRKANLAAFAAFTVRRLNEMIELKLFPDCELAIDSDLPQKTDAWELNTLKDNGNAALIETPYGMLPSPYFELLLDEVFRRLHILLGAFQEKSLVRTELVDLCRMGRSRRYCSEHGG